MNHFLLSFAASVVAGGALATATFASPQDDAASLNASGDRIDLRILYAGKPDHERTDDFIAFLEEHFIEADATSFEAVTAEEAADYDVIIFDWPSIYPRDENGAIRRDGDFRLHTPARPPLPEDWDRPSIMIGGPGQNIASMFRSKIDWL